MAVHSNTDCAQTVHDTTVTQAVHRLFMTMHSNTDCAQAVRDTAQ